MNLYFEIGVALTLILGIGLLLFLMRRDNQNIGKKEILNEVLEKENKSLNAQKAIDSAPADTHDQINNWLSDHSGE